MWTTMCLRGCSRAIASRLAIRRTSRIMNCGKIRVRGSAYLHEARTLEERDAQRDELRAAPRWEHSANLCFEEAGSSGKEIHFPRGGSHNCTSESRHR